MNTEELAGAPLIIQLFRDAEKYHMVKAGNIRQLNAAIFLSAGKRSEEREAFHWGQAERVSLMS